MNIYFCLIIYIFLGLLFSIMNLPWIWHKFKEDNEKDNDIWITYHPITPYILFFCVFLIWPLIMITTILDWIDKKCNPDDDKHYR